MKNLISFLILFFAFSSCDMGTTSHSTLLNEDTEKNDIVSPLGVVPTHLDFFKIITDTKNHNWQDLDDYYRNEILVNHKNESYFENLKNMSFFAFTRTFDLLDRADNKTIEYYFQQQVEMPYLTDTGIFTEFLIKLKKENILTGKQVSEIGTRKYFEITKHIQKNFANPKEFLEKDNRGYSLGILLKYASTAN